MRTGGFLLSSKHSERDLVSGHQDGFICHVARLNTFLGQEYAPTFKTRYRAFPVGVRGILKLRAHDHYQYRSLISRLRAAFTCLHGIKLK